MSKVDFEILIDSTLSSVTNSTELKKVLNKTLLSFANDFEDKIWRKAKFENFIWDNIAETALSAQERNALSNRDRSRLISAAKNLRLSDKDKKGEGSEIAEVFLYGIMKNHFGALPVVPKIFYKQNANDNAKGADSVHIVVKDDDFSLWFGEAKFYNSIEDSRLGAIVDSVYTSLDTQKLSKERSIITNLRDLDSLDISKNIIEKIREALKSSSSIDHLKGRLNVPILILHECKITSTHFDMTSAYRSSIINYHSERAAAYFTKQLAKASTIHKYELIKFHFILFPVPKKADLVKSFLDEVKFWKSK